MTNKRGETSGGRQEPRLSVLDLGSLDKIADGIQGDLNQDESSLGHSRQQAVERNLTSFRQLPGAAKAKTGGLWVSVVVLTLALGSGAGLFYFELNRLDGVYQTLADRINDLTELSGQMRTQLAQSDGALGQTQAQFMNRVSSLEGAIAEAKLAQNQQSTDLEGISKALKSQIQNFANQIEALQQSTQAQAASLQDIQVIKKELVDASKTLGEQIGVVKQSQTGFRSDLEEFDADLAQIKQNLERSLQILKEEMLSTTSPKLKSLEDQFAVYIQSMDQFRQQTNGNLDDLSREVRQLKRSLDQQGSGPDQSLSPSLPVGDL